MINTFSIISLIYFLLFSSMDWGRMGHHVIGEIAQKHLTPKAQKEINGLLDGFSLASVSNYADEIKSNPKYKAFQPWHYINLPINIPYVRSKRNSKGDVVMAIKKCTIKVKDPDEPKSVRAFYLKLLVHFIGDLHQPMHVGRQEDRGGNNIQLLWLGRTSNLHRLWDSHLIDHYHKSSAEWVKELSDLQPEIMEEIQQQPLEQWVLQSQDLAKIIYKNTPPNSSLGDDYHHRYLSFVKMQLLKGGLRLAAHLNKIFK
jgi:hypothetical protein